LTNADTIFSKSKSKSKTGQGADKDAPPDIIENKKNNSGEFLLSMTALTKGKSLINGKSLAKGKRHRARLSPAKHIKNLVQKFAKTTLTQIANRRLLIAQPFLLIFGIISYRSTGYEPSIMAIAFIGLGLIAIAFVNRKNNKLFSLMLVLCGFWLGFALLPIHGKLFGTPMVYGAIYGEFSARVDAIHSNDSERARIIISQISPLDGRSMPQLRRARILIPSAQLPGVGDIITSRMRLYRVPGPVVPGGYDSQFNAYFDGIGAYGSTLGDLQITTPLQRNSLARNIQDIRQFIGSRIDLALDPPLSGIARALIVGDQGQIDPQIRTKLATAGLAHVLAISGLHLTLVAGGIFIAIRMILAVFYNLAQRVSIKKIAAIGGIISALAYLALSGASVSAVRATLMLVLIFGAVLAGRRALTMRNVAFAALFVIITDPSSIYRPGFQLSFAAVIALVGAYEGYRPQTDSNITMLPRIFGFFGGIALTSLIAGAATALFAAYHFQQVAPLGVLGNMFAIPLVAFVILPFALLAVLFMPLGMEGMFFLPVGWGIEQILRAANFISNLAGDYVSSPILAPSALIIALFALAWFAFFTGRTRIIGLLVGALLIPAFGTMERPDIMIADTTQAIAIKNGTDMILVAGRDNSFAVNAWKQTYITNISPPEKSAPCDISGCWFASGTYAANKFNVALVKTRDAFAEDCWLADLVISRISAPKSCRQTTQVIDSNDLQLGGVHWGRWTGEKFVIRPAIIDIDRPWRPQYPK